MTNKEFRAAQRAMDDAGLLTVIRPIRISKKLKTVPERKVKRKVIPEHQIMAYKYSYEVMLNGTIIRACKARSTAKKHLMRLYEEKMAVNL